MQIFVSQGKICINSQIPSSGKNKKKARSIKSYFAYENMPIQIYRKFYHKKNETFTDTNSDIFHISAKNIDCGYSLEPPRRGGYNEYPHSMFEHK